MSYVCNNPEAYLGRRVGEGQCVEFVREASKAPQHNLWKKGAKVRGSVTLRKGTAIATFDDKGKYPSRLHGNHSAIYNYQDLNGLTVFDQWPKKGLVSQRYIPFRGGAVSPSDDGDAFSVIE